MVKHIHFLTLSTFQLLSANTRTALYQISVVWTINTEIQQEILLLLPLLHPFNVLFPGQPGQAGTRKVNRFGFYWSER